MKLRKLFAYSFIMVLGFILVGCDNGEDTLTTLPSAAQEALENAASKVLITDADNMTTDFTLPSLVWGTTVTWTSDHPEVLAIAANTTEVDGNAVYQVLLFPPTTVDLTVILTGTFTYETFTFQANYTVRVKAEIGLSIYSTIAALHSTAVLNDLVQVNGFVYSLYKGGYFIKDASGVAVGIFTTEENTDLIAVGDEVSVKGTYSSYNTLFQIKDLTKQTVLSHGNNVDAAPTVLTNPADLKTLSSADKTIHGRLYTVKVTPKEVVSGQNTNIYLYVGETQIAQVYYNSDVDSLAVLGNYLNQEITIDVLYYCYYDNKTVYVAFYGTAQDVTATPLSDEQKLAADLANLTLPSSALAKASLSLPSQGTNGTAISWVSGNSALALISGTNVTFGEDITLETVTLTATLTYGTLPSATKNFTLTVTGELNLAQINAMTAGTAVQAEGKVYLVLQNGYFISDGTGTLAIYTYATPTVALGDTVRVSGTVSAYGSLKQLSTITATEVISSGLRVLPETTVFDQSVEPLTGNLYRLTGMLKKEGTTYYLYDGISKICAIYRWSPTTALASLDALVNTTVTLDVFYYTLGEDSNAADAMTHFFAFDNFAATLTDVQKVARDLSDLTIPETGYIGKFIVLPKTGYYGTAITYSVDIPSAVTIDNTGSETILTFNTATTVMITASGHLGVVNQDASFDVSLVTLTITSIPDVYAGTDGNRVFVEGIVTGFDGLNGLFIQDENKNGLYIDAYFPGVVLGSRITVSAEIATITGIGHDFHYLSDQDIILIANDRVVHETLTTDFAGNNLALLYNDPDILGKLVSITSLTVDKYEGGYVYFLLTTVASANVYLKVLVTDTWMPTIYSAVSVISLAEVLVYRFDGNHLLGLNLVLPELTDTQKVGLDLNLVPTELSVTTEIDLPELTYGSYSNFVFSAELNGIVTYSAGSFTINRPATGQPNALGTLTVTVTLGMFSEVKIINLTVLAIPAEGTTVFTETFDNPSPNKIGYAPGDVTFSSGSWNLAAALTNTSAEPNDKVYDPSSATLTASGTGGKGKSVRLHPNNDNKVTIEGNFFAVLSMNFDTTNMTSVSFYSAMYGTYTGSTVTVQVSVDGGTTWNTVGSASPTANMTLTTVTLTSMVTGRLRFLVSGTRQVNIDQVVVKGN